MALIVFDLDGTLIDSAPDIHLIANNILASEGRAPLSLDDARDFIGNGASVFVQKMRKARDIGDEEHERLLGLFMAGYDDAIHLTKSYEGVGDMLTKLKADGHQLGICTNKPLRPCTIVLTHLGLDGFFGAILGGDSLSTHKPDPAPLHATFEKLGDGPRVYVGDSDVDAETSERAGVPFLIYAHGYAKRPIGELVHDHAFEHHDEVVGLVGQILRRNEHA